MSILCSPISTQNSRIPLLNNRQVNTVHHLAIWTLHALRKRADRIEQVLGDLLREHDRIWRCVGASDDECGALCGVGSCC